MLESIPKSDFYGNSEKKLTTHKSMVDSPRMQIMYKSKRGFLDLDTESLKSGPSRASATSSVRKAKEIEARKKTRIIGGHGMAIRDSNKGNQMLHKLYSNGKLTHTFVVLMIDNSRYYAKGIR